MPIYEVTESAIQKLTKTTFSAAEVRERADLQRLLRTNIEVVSPDTLIIAEEFGDWEDCRRRIDLLGLDRDANLVVIELKRTEDGGHMELQAIRYAAMVSTLTFEKVVDVYADHLRRIGHEQEIDARTSILEFLGWEEEDEDMFAQDARIVLASAEFSKELTTAVIWLNDHGLDIRCVRMQPYDYDGRLLVDVQQVIPLPEAADYQVQVRGKEQRGRQKRAERSVITRRFWQGLLTRAATKTKLHANVQACNSQWLSAGSGMGGLSFNYVIRKNDGDVALYIDRGADETNKTVFDHLHAKMNDIERAFGGKLSWQRLDARRGCSIAHTISSGGYRSEESTWPEIQDAMIDSMIRLEAAMRPHVLAMKQEYA